MRTIPAFLAVTALAAVALVGCSTSTEASCVNPTASEELDGLVSVSGPSTSAPDVQMRTPFHTDSTTSWQFETGEGAPITQASQPVALDISLFSGETGDPLVATSYDPEATPARTLTQWTQNFTALPEALECATPGARVVVGFSPDDIAPEARAGLGLDDGESAVAVVDVREVFLPRADGADQYIESPGLPAVVRAPDGRPGIIVPEATAPTEPTVEVLKRGDGATVTGDAPVVLHLTSVQWNDPAGTMQSTWGAEPSVAPLTGLPPVLADALEGQTVGSQVLVVQPAEESTPSSDTVVWVFDILGIDD